MATIANFVAGTGVPPEMADYEQLPDRTFDGELCHVVRSSARQEMLLISQASGLLRGYVLINPSGYPDEFCKSEKVKEISGVEFSSQREYSNWSRDNELKMSDQQKWDLAKEWSLACDWSSPPASLLVRFRDYREIAPGIMWPFREDRVQGPMRNEKFEYMRSYEHVHEVVVDRDLTDSVNALRPKDGEQVQDQRFQAIVDYKYSKDRSNTEIMKLVDEAFERQMKDQLVVEQAKKPYESMIGKPAPKLPEQNWVGGQRPELGGKPYLVHLWATWCGPCKNDVPLLKRFSAAGGIVIGMHPGGTTTEEVTATIKAGELSYPTYVSPETTSADNPTIAGYPATMYPYCVLVNGKGMVVAHGSLRDDKFDVFAQYWELVKIGKTNSLTTP
jgi:thiol-disulfide isomerase/thioredoxin